MISLHAVPKFVVRQSNTWPRSARQCSPCRHLQQATIDRSLFVWDRKRRPRTSNHLHEECDQGTEAQAHAKNDAIPAQSRATCTKRIPRAGVQDCPVVEAQKE